MRFRTLVLALLMAVGVPAQAQAARKIWIGVNGGPGLPTAEFDDVFETGWNASFSFDYLMSDRTSVGLTAGRLAFGADRELETVLSDAVSLQAGRPVDVDVSVGALPLLARASYRFPTIGQASPYLVGGAGVSFVETKIGTDVLGESSESTTNFAYELGGGVRFEATERVRVVVEGVHCQIHTERHPRGPDGPHQPPIAGSDPGTPLTLLTIRAGVEFGFAP